MSDTTKTATQLVAALAREGVKLPVKVHPEDRATVADANDADLFVVDNNSDRLDENAYAITELLVDLINTTASQPGETAPVGWSWDELCKRTFAIQHSPNCPSQFLVRLPGKSGLIDMKPYGDVLGLVQHQTGDVLGFGKTLQEAGINALAKAQEGGTNG